MKGEIEISAEIPVGLYYRLAELAAVSGMTLEETLRQAINYCAETVALYSKPGLYIEHIQRLNNMAQKYDPGAMYDEILISNYDTSKVQPLQMSFSMEGLEERNYIWRP